MVGSALARAPEHLVPDCCGLDVARRSELRDVNLDWRAARLGVVGGVPGQPDADAGARGKKCLEHQWQNDVRLEMFFLDQTPQRRDPRAVTGRVVASPGRVVATVVHVVGHRAGVFPSLDRGQERGDVG